MQSAPGLAPLAAPTPLHAHVCALFSRTHALWRQAQAASSGSCCLRARRRTWQVGGCGRLLTLQQRGHMPHSLLQPVHYLAQRGLHLSDAVCVTPLLRASQLLVFLARQQCSASPLARRQQQAAGSRQNAAPKSAPWSAREHFVAPIVLAGARGSTELPRKRCREHLSALILLRPAPGSTILPP